MKAGNIFWEGEEGIVMDYFILEEFWFLLLSFEMFQSSSRIGSYCYFFIVLLLQREWIK